MSLIKFSNVSFLDKKKVILSDITIDIQPQDFISIVGPSGSGKSTFLKLCSDLISVSSGNIYYKNKIFNDYNPTELRKLIAYCFQTPHLFGETVMDNVSFPFTIRNEKLNIARVKEVFSLFNMDFETYINQKVQSLSGGEKQRISLIRTLIFKPEVLLLDEVTSALDKENTAIVENVIKKLNDNGITVLWITHNEKQSKKYANKLLTIENGNIKSLEVLK